MPERYGERYSEPWRSRYGEDRERYRDDYERAMGRYRGESYYGAPERGRSYGYEREGRGSRGESGREPWRDRDDERGLFDRAGDEVRSWFGDEEAQRRRMMDEREGTGPGERGRGYERRGGDEWGFGPWPGGRHYDQDWARQWGYVDPQERRGGYGGPYGQGRFGGGMPGGETWQREPRGWGHMGATQGPHAGRGPRGWQRSDERIREDVCERMSRHGDLDASDIEIRVTNGEVTLQGTVQDRSAKRLAEDIAEDVSGVRDIHNQIRVATGQQQGEAQRWQGDRRAA